MSCTYLLLSSIPNFVINEFLWLNASLINLQSLIRTVLLSDFNTSIRYIYILLLLIWSTCGTAQGDVIVRSTCINTT